MVTRRLWTGIISLAFLASVADANEAAIDPSAEFDRARAAYDAGAPKAAALLYEKILAAGYDAPELRFNLGNARFRAGETPEAIRQYLIAARARPRDPDIAKNLAYAIEQAGAARPAPPILRAWARRLTASEWLALAAGAGGSAALLLAASFLAIRGRGAWRRAAAAAFAVALAAALGALEWRDLSRRPEAVVARSDAPARFAPLDNATVHFTLPAGSIVRVIGRDGAWRRVALDGREGWLPESDLLGVP